jgi:hypothetical protein
MSIRHTPDSRSGSGIVDAMDRHGPRITEGWSGERAVLIPALVVAAVAVAAMAYLEHLY